MTCAFSAVKRHVSAMDEKAIFFRRFPIAFCIQHGYVAQANNGAVNEIGLRKLQLRIVPDHERAHAPRPPQGHPRIRIAGGHLGNPGNLLPLLGMVMIFSERFTKALEALRQTPRDPYQEALDWAKANPYFRLREAVALYDDPDQGRFIGYGRVSSMRWCDDYETWLLTVAMQNGALIEKPSYCARDASPHELRNLLVALKGGRA